MFCLFLLNFMKVGNKYTFIHSFRIHIKPVALQVKSPPPNISWKLTVLFKYDICSVDYLLVVLFLPFSLACLDYKNFQVWPVAGFALISISSHPSSDIISWACVRVRDIYIYHHFHLLSYSSEAFSQRQIFKKLLLAFQRTSSVVLCDRLWFLLAAKDCMFMPDYAMK